MNKFRSFINRAVSSRHFVLIILLLGFLVRLGWILLIDAKPLSDFQWYYERGVDIAQGRGYSIDGVPTAYWPVGYPAFLGVIFMFVGRCLFVAKLFNVILYLGAVFFSYYLAKRLFDSEITGRLTLLLLLFYPNHIAYCSLLAPEILFLFLILAGSVSLAVRKHEIIVKVISGFIFGLACLVKPLAIFIPLVFFMIILMKDAKQKSNRLLAKNFIYLTVLYLSLGIAILPWTIRNYSVYHRFVFISNNGGINLLIGNNPYAKGNYMWDDRLDSLLTDTDLDEAERDKRASLVALRYIAAHPWQTVKLWPKKFWYLYKSDVEGITWNERGMMRSEFEARGNLLVFRVIAQIYYLLIIVLSSLLVFSFRHRKPKQSVLQGFGIWLLVYFTAVYLLLFADTRFHFPVMPWIIMYAAAYLETFARV